MAPHFKRASSIGVAETAITHKPLTGINHVATGDGFRKPFAEVNRGVVAVAEKPPFPSDNPGAVVLNESKSKFYSCVSLLTPFMLVTFTQ